MRLLLPLALVLLALACGNGGASDAFDAAGETDAVVTFDAVEAAEVDATPTQLCKARFRAEIPSTGPVRAPLVGDDGSLYVVSGDLAMSLTAEGLERWRQTVPPEGDTGVVLGNPALLDDAIVVGSTQGLLVKLALKDGQERWRFKNLKEKVTTAPVRVGETYVVAGSETLFFLGEPAANQVVVTHVEGLSVIPLQPVVQGDAALIATGGRVLRRAADGSGDDIVVFEEDEGTLTSPPTPLGDGRWVLGADWNAEGAGQRGLVVVDPAAGASSPVGVQGLLDGPSMLVVVGGGRVLGVTPSGEGLVVDLDAPDANARFALGGQAVGHPLVGNDGVWYLSVGQGAAGVKLSARAVSAGAADDVLWTDTLDGGQPGPLGMTAGGTVLFPVGLKLHGYRCGTSSLADVPWPKFQNDPANTGAF